VCAVRERERERERERHFGDSNPLGRCLWRIVQKWMYSKTEAIPIGTSNAMDSQI